MFHAASMTDWRLAACSVAALVSLAHGYGVDYSVSQTADRLPVYVSSSERSAVAWAERSGSSAPVDCDSTPVFK